MRKEERRGECVQANLLALYCSGVANVRIRMMGSECVV